MNKTLLSAALIASFGFAALAPLGAQAASTGTINFTGKVLADTCAINVNGSGTSTVALPTVMTAAFGASVGTVAGATPFTIALTGCDPNTASAKMAFNGTNVDSTTGNLKNATGGGSNVQIQLLNSSNAAINTSTQVNAPTIAVAAGAGSTSLTAQYISTAIATTAGLVTSSVGFTLTYQ
ncbi:MAG: fimbrial protein [Lysobacterales bacterium]|jgi:major type 1 subunit fimbrin (pilin)